jgi:predicted ATP-grasp superfamily ATP-dependent carboligase
MNRGRLRAAFAHRRLREKPPSGGVSVLSESIALDPQVLEQAERILEALKWHGVAMVEFKRDARDGVAKLGINGRFWGSLQLSVDAGVGCLPAVPAGAGQ